METGNDGNVYATVGGNFFKVDAITKGITVLASGVRKLAQDDFGSFYMFTDPETPDLYKYTIDELILKLTGVELSVPAAQLKTGEQTSVELIGQLEKGRSTRELSGAAKVYTSTNPSVAEVDSNGVVTAKGAGTTQIRIQVTVAVPPAVPGGTPTETRTFEVDLESVKGDLGGVSLTLTRTKDQSGLIKDELQLGKSSVQAILDRIGTLGSVLNSVHSPL